MNLPIRVWGNGYFKLMQGMPEMTELLPANSKPKLRWFQYSLRTLLIFVTLFGAVCSWLGVKLEQTRRQRETVEEITKAGGSVLYNLPELHPGFFSYTCPPPDATWLRRLLGNDFFDEVNLVCYKKCCVPDANWKHLKELPHLRTLDLYGSNITQNGWNQLFGLEQLQSLDLGGTDVTDASLGHLQGMKHLTTLGLANTAITDAGLEHLEKMPQLQVVALVGTKISGNGLVHLKKLTHLERLTFSGISFTDANVMQLKEIPQMHDLSLMGRQVTNVEMQRLKELPQLEYLLLQGPNIIDDDLAMLKDLPNLYSLVLHTSQVTDLPSELRNCKKPCPL
jgi:hypothetical protein